MTGNKTNVVHLLYFSVLAVWTLYVLLNPPWIGRSYFMDQYSEPATWQSNGIFGLRGYDATVPRSPIWNPPVAHSDMISATVRWPWQSVTSTAHVELSIVSMARLLSYGLIVLGLVFGLISLPRSASRNDCVITYAWSVALCLIVSLIAIFVLSVASMGYAATPTMVTSLLLAGVAGGLIYGFISHSRKVARHAKSPTQAEKLVDGDLVGTKRLKRDRSWRPGPMSLLLFVIGLVVSCVIAWTAIDVAIAISPSQLLGTTVNGFGEVSGWMRVLTGLGIVALGWILAIMLWWATWIRGFAYGLITGASALGTLCVFWH